MFQLHVLKEKNFNAAIEEALNNIHILFYFLKTKVYSSITSSVQCIQMLYYLFQLKNYNVSS